MSKISNALRDALVDILEEPGLKIPADLRRAGVKACADHERSINLAVIGACDLIETAGKVINHMASTFNDNWCKIDKTDILEDGRTVEKAVFEWVKQIADFKKMSDVTTPGVIKVLKEFITDIETAGSVGDWTDLSETYEHACKALGWKPKKIRRDE